METIKKGLISLVLAFILSLISGKIFVKILRKNKVGQPILSYVKEHEEKSGTPTMGGLFFILSSVIIFCIFNKLTYISLQAIVIGVSFLLVGFLDDFLKIKKGKNEGLKAYQKIIFQILISIIAGVFSYINGLTVAFIPFLKRTLDLKIYIIPIVAFVFIAITNGVNLTDGLDGLAGSVSAVYLLNIAIIILLEINIFESNFIRPNEYLSLVVFSFALVGGILGFLCFNVNKARVFMGDTGSLSLGGFLGAISIFSSNVFIIPILGIVFIISVASVII
ncbi:MAG: phospho-N-acetylmuramoyl-pentapeptide-transferase, partial [Clostridia bacterium]|nr:phospho-N-acetylmuramoyl-pentapeptide-transferase [Clostridia bacterium]